MKANNTYTNDSWEKPLHSLTIRNITTLGNDLLRQNEDWVRDCVWDCNCAEKSSVGIYHMRMIQSMGTPQYFPYSKEYFYKALLQSLHASWRKIITTLSFKLAGIFLYMLDVFLGSSLYLIIMIITGEEWAKPYQQPDSREARRFWSKIWEWKGHYKNSRMNKQHGKRFGNGSLRQNQDCVRDCIWNWDCAEESLVGTCHMRTSPSIRGTPTETKRNQIIYF